MMIIYTQGQKINLIKRVDHGESWPHVSKYEFLKKYQ